MLYASAALVSGIDENFRALVLFAEDIIVNIGFCVHANGNASSWFSLSPSPSIANKSIIININRCLRDGNEVIRFQFDSGSCLAIDNIVGNRSGDTRFYIDGFSIGVT